METIQPSEFFIQRLRERLANLRSQYPEIFKIFSYTHKMELTCLNWLVSLLLPKSTIFEIGSHLGASACFMAAAAKENKSLVTCVDTWDNRAMPEKDKGIDSKKEFAKNTKIFIEDDVLTPIVGFSSEIAKDFYLYTPFSNSPMINLLFIDGDHSYEGVTADIEPWIPLCAPGCIVVFHDYGGKYGRPAIRQAVEEKIWPIQKGPGNVFDSLYWCTI